MTPPWIVYPMVHQMIEALHKIDFDESLFTEDADLVAWKDALYRCAQACASVLDVDPNPDLYTLAAHAYCGLADAPYPADVEPRVLISSRHLPPQTSLMLGLMVGAAASGWKDATARYSTGALQ